MGLAIPPYAILSHTWGEDEVTFRDMRKYREAAKEKAGYTKIQKCCEKARQDGHQYVWIDTCCIDKRSSAELSEAINSMWKWYRKSEVCYAYLGDVPSEGFISGTTDYSELFRCRWFTRGWTLQELIAPCNLLFLGQDWRVIGMNRPLAFLEAFIGEQTPMATNARNRHRMFLSKIAEITGIAERVLRFEVDIRLVPAAQKMAWAARRQTAREEDLAYALMGLFDVNMPILYGEGLKKAFRRLQLEIIQMNSTDQSIFIWRTNKRISGLLADYPEDFADSGLNFVWKNQKLQPYSMTNMGLLVNLPVLETGDGNCVVYPRCCK